MASKEKELAAALKGLMQISANGAAAGLNRRGGAGDVRFDLFEQLHPSASNT
jgi:hypothetical protein